FLHRAGPILLRRRSARQDHIPVHPRCRRQVVYDRNLPATSQACLQAVAPFRDCLIVAVECLFCWYWLAELCAKEKIAFVLGQALHMKAIHGGKSKNDQIDAGKIARLLRGGTLPRAYVYPAGMREIRERRQSDGLT